MFWLPPRERGWPHSRTLTAAPSEPHPAPSAGLGLDLRIDFPGGSLVLQPPLFGSIIPAAASLGSMCGFLGGDSGLGCSPFGNPGIARLGDGYALMGAIARAALFALR